MFIFNTSRLSGIYDVELFDFFGLVVSFSMTKKTMLSYTFSKRRKGIFNDALNTVIWRCTNGYRKPAAATTWATLYD